MSSQTSMANEESVVFSSVTTAVVVSHCRDSFYTRLFRDKTHSCLSFEQIERQSYPTFMRVLLDKCYQSSCKAFSHNKLDTEIAAGGVCLSQQCMLKVFHWHLCNVLIIGSGGVAADNDAHKPRAMGDRLHLSDYCECPTYWRSSLLLEGLFSLLYSPPTCLPPFLRNT